MAYLDHPRKNRLVKMCLNQFDGEIKKRYYINCTLRMKKKNQMFIEFLNLSLECITMIEFRNSKIVLNTNYDIKYFLINNLAHLLRKLYFA